jgi:hypothetical protein
MRYRNDDYYYGREYFQLRSRPTRHMLELLLNTEDRKRPDNRCCRGVCHLERHSPSVRQFNVVPDRFIVDRLRFKLNLVRYKYIIPNLEPRNKLLIRKGISYKSDMRMSPNPPLPDRFRFDFQSLYIRCSDIHKPEIVISAAAFNEALPDSVRSCSAKRKEEVIWASNDAGKGD